MEKLEKGSYEYPWSETGDTEFAQRCRKIRFICSEKIHYTEADEAELEAITVLQLARERRVALHGEEGGYDLHCQNFLLRGEQLVITDPLT
jgi:hypothetical protein